MLWQTILALCWAFISYAGKMVRKLSTTRRMSCALLYALTSSYPFGVCL